MVAELSVSGAALSRLVRRGLQAAPIGLEQLRSDAEAYERAGPKMEIKPEQVLPALITGFIFLFILASIRYTVGDVIASLAMIESPSTTAIVEPSPPAYSESIDSKSEKEPLVEKSDIEADVGVTIINHKPITANIFKTIGHLQRQGGFRSRWRGCGWSLLYHGAHSLINHFLASIFGFSWISNALFFMATSVLLSRLHMTWTHAMIAQPATTSFYQQMVPTKYNARVLALPTLVFAFAQQMTFATPMIVASVLGLMSRGPAAHGNGSKHTQICATMLTLFGLRVFAVIASGLTVAFTLLLPASITLTRIEASLLAEDREAIVPFDRDAIAGELDLTSRSGRKTLFVQTWRSVDCAVRMRLIKLYIKMALLQLTVAIVGFSLMSAEVYWIGGQKVKTFLKSAHAQAKLAMIETS